MEVAPQFDGEGSELGDILPDIIGEFGSFLPKWAQPFLKDPEMAKWAIEYAGKHPDTAKKWFGKMMGKKGTPTNDENQTEQPASDTISV